MPQFVRNGPIVPDKLVQDLEDDRVIIFCGAGISMGAGLPSYMGLVAHCYRELSHPLPADGSSEWIWPDRMLGALESRYSSERVRKLVAERLSRRPRDLELHRAILRLARLRGRDGLRLVTTNFDTLFEKAGKSLRLRYGWHAGPVLPIPRNDRSASWRSLIYLHGRLGGVPTQQLVLTSADFGRAYLTDAWAARFVARLFADFTVLFIGYSLNDPVLRYMTDAFAAEDAEMRFGQPRAPAYIFTSFEGEVAPDPRPFLDRNLEPIFYKSADAHLSLRQTVVAWADAREDYLASVGRLIREIAPRRPDAIDPTDTANLLWAVVGRPGDEGHGARVFAAVEDLPPIEWLEEFEAREAELLDAHATACVAAERAGRIAPPAPLLNIAPLFQAVLDERDLGSTPVGLAMIEWLIRHLSSEGLVERVLGKLARGRRPNAQLRRQIRLHLATDHGLRAGYERFWRILAAEGGWMTGGQRVRPGAAWVVRNSLKDEADSAWLRLELLAGLRPILELSRSPHRRFLEAIEPNGAASPIGDRLSEIVDADVIFADRDHVAGMIEAINARPGADAFWAENVDELTSLLAHALHLFAAADDASEAIDPSAFQRPSIVPHQQNHQYRQWTVLFDLIWQGWTHIDAFDREHSRAIVTRWRGVPYFAFRRLVLAAMSHSTHFSAEERMEALLNG